MAKICKHTVIRKSDNKLTMTHKRIFTPSDVQRAIEGILMELIPDKTLSEIGYIGTSCNEDFRIKIKMSRAMARPYLDISDTKLTYDGLEVIEGLLVHNLKESVEEVDNEICVVNLNRQIAPMVISEFPLDSIVSITYNPILLLEGSPYLVIVESTSTESVSVRGKLDFHSIIDNFES